MALIAMNRKAGKAPDDFVRFAIEYTEPGGQKFFALKNRLSFSTTRATSIQTSCQLGSRPFKSFDGYTFHEMPTSPASFSTESPRSS